MKKRIQILKLRGGFTAKKPIKHGRDSKYSKNYIPQYPAALFIVAHLLKIHFIYLDIFLSLENQKYLKKCLCMVFYL